MQLETTIHLILNLIIFGPFLLWGVFGFYYHGIQQIHDIPQGHWFYKLRINVWGSIFFFVIGMIAILDVFLPIVTY